MRTPIRWLTTGLVAVMRLLYGYRVEGLENLPRHGPCLLLLNEIGFMGSLGTSVALARLALSGRMEGPVGVAVEDALAFGPWRRVFRLGQLLAVPPGARQGPAVLWSGLQALRAGKMLVINPDGEVSWDGHPPPLKPGVAWMALRAGAPLVPFVATQGAYEIWPRWADRPQWRGHFAVRIGEPFVLAGAPALHVDALRIKEANRIIAERLEALVDA